MHAYNATHVVQLRGKPDRGLIQKTIETALRIRGLTGLSLDRKAGTYCYDGESLQVEIKYLPEQVNSFQVIEKEIQHQLNTPFVVEDGFNPFRFFIGSQGDSFFLGTTYFHPMADAEAVSTLMRDIVSDYTGSPASGAPQTYDCHPARHDRVVRSHPGVVARNLLAAPSSFRTMRRSFRPPIRDADDLNVRFTFMPLTEKVLPAMIKQSKSWGVKVHDLLLALLMKALSPIAAGRFHETRRRNISLGSIVNVRRDYDLNGERVFGLFLGSYFVSHPVSEGVSLKQLAADIRLQTLRIKRRKLYLASPLELAFAGFVMDLYSTSRQKKFYPKNHPLWGGITNMNMNPSWEKCSTDAPINYFRAVSTGPVTPLVLSATSFKKSMNLGITYRSTVFTSEEIERLKTELLRGLQSIQHSA